LQGGGCFGQVLRRLADVPNFAGNCFAAALLAMTMGEGRLGEQLE
jgi:hypothetical protein